MKIKVGISNHHVHLKQTDLEILFGKDFKLEKKQDLVQSKEFASTSKVTLKGPKGQIDNVRVLGPIRNYSQVEISRTDSYILGLNPPVRSSGDLLDSSYITIVGPKGQVTLNEGCIIANRHIHLTKENRIELGLVNVDKVKIKISNEKGGILDNVYLKESEKFKLECHLDTDDGNANLLKTGDEVEIVKD